MRFSNEPDRPQGYLRHVGNRGAAVDLAVLGIAVRRPASVNSRKGRGFQLRVPVPVSPRRRNAKARGALIYMLLRDELKPVLILLGAVIVSLTIKEVKLHGGVARQSAEVTEQIALD